MEQAELDVHLKAIEGDGFSVIENVIPPELIAALKDRVRACEVESVGPIEDLETADDDFSFMRTAGLLRLDPVFHQVPIHEEVLQLVEAVLGQNVLLSAFSAMDVQPGKLNIQPIHPDDALVPVPRPHFKPIGCTAMWVLTDFNAHTGGTRFIPGSQRDPLDLVFTQDPEGMKNAIQPDVKAGSIIVFDHAVLHSSANNYSDEWRLGLQISYHAGWIRPFTNWFLSVPLEEARTYPQKLQDLMGYKVYAGGIGSHSTAVGSYHESYGRLRAPGDTRNRPDSSEQPSD
jgi:ectoine hydroxylase-related dioxygenase (phytanoyl-CoA dioxygenase family)